MFYFKIISLHYMYSEDLRPLTSIVTSQVCEIALNLSQTPVGFDLSNLQIEIEPHHA